MSAEADPDRYRADSREEWERSAAGWGKMADGIRDWGAPVSEAMVDALEPAPGDRVLELAAGPGDTGFVAAGRIAPGGLLVCSDGAEAMLDVARERAAKQGIGNVEFRQLELEWIDLPTADVDAVLCRWGIMLLADPEAAAREIRRVLRPGGRAALAVWDLAERNPWATIPRTAMLELGHGQPPDPDTPGMFSLGAEGALAELLGDAGFLDVAVTVVALERHSSSVDEYLDQTVEMAAGLRAVYHGLSADQRLEIRERIASAALPYTGDDGSLTIPGSSLVARAAA